MGISTAALANSSLLWILASLSPKNMGKIDKQVKHSRHCNSSMSSSSSTQLPAMLKPVIEIREIRKRKITTLTLSL